MAAKNTEGREAVFTKETANQAADVGTAQSVDASLTPSGEPREDETLEQSIERIRALRERTRQEWGAFTQKLALPPRIGYHRHWFNDVAGRIEEAKSAGWAHVKNPRDNTPLKRTVGTGRDSNVLVAYAMELPQIFWQEEMDARNKVASDKVAAIKAKPFSSQPGQAQASDQGKFYSPNETGPIQVTKG
jgi:hypothetical protein